MKKSLVIIAMLSSMFLLGCFHKKEKEVVVEPVIIEEPTIVEVDTGDVSSGDIVEYPNELDENGEFDPKKFEDEDIEEVMKLLEDLIQE